MEELQTKRADLEKQLKRKEDTHYKKPFWHSESAYRDSVQEMRKIYNELFSVAQELGEPIPVWM